MPVLISVQRNAQVFLLAISIPLMLLAALVEERGRTEQSLRARQRELAEVNRKTTIGVMAAQALT
jgi:hypothetical protein